MGSFVTVLVPGGWGNVTLHLDDNRLLVVCCPAEGGRVPACSPLNMPCRLGSSVTIFPLAGAVFAAFGLVPYAFSAFARHACTNMVPAAVLLAPANLGVRAVLQG